MVVFGGMLNNFDNTFRGAGYGLHPFLFIVKTSIIQKLYKRIGMIFLSEEVFLLSL